MIASVSSSERAPRQREIDRLFKDDFKTFARQLLVRRDRVRGLPVTDDALEKLYDAVAKLSKLSH